MTEKELLEKISVVLAVVSLFLTVYFRKEEVLQSVFILLFILFVIFYLIYKNNLLIKENTKSVKDFDVRLKNIEKNLSIYERLNSLEKEVFKK